MSVEADPKTLWWLSFAGDEGFRGVLVIPATGFIESVMLSHKLGLNPGGSVIGYSCPEYQKKGIPESHVGRLLTRDECREIGGISEAESNEIQRTQN